MNPGTVCILKGFAPTGGAATTKGTTVRSLNCIEGTLSAYAGHSAIDAAQKPMNRQWTENPSDLFVGGQVGLM